MTPSRNPAGPSPRRQSRPAPPGAKEIMRPLIFLLAACLLLASCASQRQYEPILPAGSMVDSKNPRKAEAKSRAITDDAERRAETEETLRKLATDNDRLNRRLQGVTAEKRPVRSSVTATTRLALPPSVETRTTTPEPTCFLISSAVAEALTPSTA